MPSMKPNVFVVNNHDSFTYNLVELLRKLRTPFYVCDVEKVVLADITPFSHILLSPGPDIPRAYPTLFAILERFADEKPILGICLGHQCLWEFFGGTLQQLPHPRHGEKRFCHHFGNTPLFTGVAENFAVGLYHSWAVDKTTKPCELDIIAYDDENVVQATAHKTLPIYSLQFHPESVMSEFGLRIMQNWLNH